jgi:hypothetical protein
MLRKNQLSESSGDSETADFSEMLVTIYQTTRRLISEDNNLHGHHRENLKPQSSALKTEVARSSETFTHINHDIYGVIIQKSQL